MIAGIGVDLFETRRFRKFRNNPDFLNQIFSATETARAKNRPPKDPSPAVFFAVKESVRKALGKELAVGWFWRHVRIGPGLVIRIMKNMKRLRLRKDFKILHSAAAHCRHTALALTVIEK